MTFTKEQLIAAAHGRIDFANMMLSDNPEPLQERTWSIELALASNALLALRERAEPVEPIWRAKKYPVNRPVPGSQLIVWDETGKFVGYGSAVYTRESGVAIQMSDGRRFDSNHTLRWEYALQAPPAPVVADDRESFEKFYGSGTTPGLDRVPPWFQEMIKDAFWEVWKGSRAALQQQPVSQPYKLPESKEQAEATFRLPDTWMFRWGFENHPANVPVFSADKPTTVVDSKVVSCNPPEGDVQFIHCDLPASWEGKVSAIGCRFNQADPPPHVDIPEEKATDWSEKPIPNGIWFDKVEQSKVKGLTAVRECSKHPGTKLLVHPMLLTASIPPQPIYYCPKCEPKFFEWAERNNPFKPGGGK